MSGSGVFDENRCEFREMVFQNPVEILVSGFKINELFQNPLAAIVDDCGRGVFLYIHSMWFMASCFFVLLQKEQEATFNEIVYIQYSYLDSTVFFINTV